MLEALSGRLRAAPLLAPALALPAGVALAPLLPAPPGLPAALPAALLFLALLAATLARRPLPLTGAAAALLLLAGLARAHGAGDLPTDDISHWNGGFVEVAGVVADEPDVRDRSTLLRLQVRTAASGPASRPTWRVASGEVQLRVPLSQTYAYGDVLDVRGQLQAPPELPAFDYRDYLARQGVRSVFGYARVARLAGGAGDPLHAALVRLRQRIASALDAALPEPEASLQRAILIGTRSATFSDLTPEFIRTGMIHLVATSGFKVAIIGGSLLAFATPLLGRRRAACPALAGVALYVLLTGATPAGMRAGLMWALALGALVAGRPAASLQALALAAAAMVAARPALLGDTGFQLSAGATGGILLLEPRVAPWLRRLPAWCAEPVGVTLAAQAATLPVTMVGFGQVSLVAPLANLLCLPLLPAATAAGALTAAAQAFSPAGGHLAALPAYGFLAAMIDIVHLLARVPGAALPAPAVGGLFALLYYAGLLALLPLLPREGAGERHAAGHLPPAARLALAGGLTAAVALLHALRAGPPAGTELAFLDVGRGDALLVRTGGGAVLVDAGAGAQQLRAQLGETLPFWQGRLDALVLLGAEEAHAGAAGALPPRYTLGRVLLPAPSDRPTLAAAQLRGRLPANATVLAAPATASLRLPGGLDLEAWPVGPAGAPHLALRLQAGEIALLDVAALSPADQRQLLAAGYPLQAAVLIAPRGGASSALDPAFLAAVHPALLLAAAPPAQSAEAAPDVAPLLRTDQAGAIRLLTDGRSLRLE